MFGKKKQIKALIGLVDQVKIGLYLYLLPAYKSKLDKEQAARLIAAVLNMVFCEPPTGDIGAEFISDEDNVRRVKSVIEEHLQGQEKLKRIITDAVRVLCTARHGLNPKMSPDEFQRQCKDPIDRIRELGLLIPGGEAPSPTAFGPDVLSFLDEVKGGFSATP